MINNSSTRLTKVIKDVILAGIEGYNFTDCTQFLVEVTSVSTVLGIFTTVCLLFYVKVTCPCFVYGDGTRPRTFHSARYQIVRYNPKANKAKRYHYEDETENLLFQIIVNKNWEQRKQ